MNLKFRVWDKKTNCFLESMNDWGILFSKKSAEWLPINAFLGSDYVIRQFTGLKDKNGKEIYQGDIVKFKGSNKNYPWRVIWDITDAGFKLADSNDDAYWLKLSEVENLQITGNIFKNKR